MVPWPAGYRSPPVETALYRRLLPDRGETDAHGYVESLELGDAGTAPQRPYALVNFVSSLDGHATVDGQSRKLSESADRELFYALRERVDAVLIGTHTLAAEHYKRMLPASERRDRRIAAGRTAEPLAVTVSRSGWVPREVPLFEQPADRVLVFEGEEASLTDVMRILRHEHGVRTLLCEGGPTLFGALVRERLVDELFLTVAPRLVADTSGPAVVSGPPPEAPAKLELAGVLERDGTLFLRYRFKD
jgi:riboflavin biosynthesis pyrimidine reductase